MLMATAFFRTIILYLLLIAGLRLTGKRQIGELEPIELVLTMLLSDLASVPMQDFDSPLINGVVPHPDAAGPDHAAELYQLPQRAVPVPDLRGAGHCGALRQAPAAGPCAITA